MNNDPQSNPFQPPNSVNEPPKVVGVVGGTREDLRKVATYQRYVLICILVQFLALLGQSLVPPEMKLLSSVVVVLVGLASTVFVFMLSTKVYSTATGVIMGILTLIPCIGLISLVIINQKATAVLKDNGIHVGFMVADPNKI